jgi:hypothetical protein
MAAIQIPLLSRTLSSPHGADRLWGLHNLLSSAYQVLFAQGVKLTSHLLLIPRAIKLVALPYIFVV